MIPSRFSPYPQKATREESDLFKMKALTLLKNYFNNESNLRTTLDTIHKTPITVTQSDASNRITLEQEITPFMGKTVVLTGSFIRSETNSIPISGSFHLYHPIDGHPFPTAKQMNGWALTRSFLPFSVQYPERLPLFSQLLDHPLPTTSLKTPCTGNTHMIQSLCLSIIHHSPLKVTHAETITNDWIHSLEKTTNPKEKAIEAWERIFIIFVDQPVKQLRQTWKQGSIPALHDPDPTTVYTAALKFLTEARIKGEESIPQDSSFAFIQMMGKYIGTAAIHLTLQNLSELLKIAPPTLSHFENTLQSAAISQWEAHIQKKEFNPIENFQKTANKQLPLHPIVSEIQNYYANSFQLL